jgi:hypothetical protein
LERKFQRFFTSSHNKQIEQVLWLFYLFLQFPRTHGLLILELTISNLLEGSIFNLGRVYFESPNICWKQ